MLFEKLDGNDDLRESLLDVNRKRHKEKSRHSHGNNDRSLHTNSWLRCNVEEIRTYLESVDYIDVTWNEILHIYILKPISFIANILFIIYNTISFNQMEYSHNLQLMVGQYIVLLAESLGILFGILFILRIIIFTRNVTISHKIVLIIKWIEFMGEWSVLKLFYLFRPTAVIDYLDDIWNNNWISFENTQIRICKSTLNEINQLNVDMNSQNINNINNIKRKLLDIMDTSNDNKLQTNFVSKIYVMFGSGLFKIFSLIIIFGLLIIGFIGFIMKLSKFGFISNTYFWEWSLYPNIFEILFLSNQFWNVSNQSCIQTDAMLQVLTQNVVGTIALNKYFRLKKVVLSTLHLWVV